MHNVSATGIKMRLVASLTFPAGFDITQFADDGDPLNSENLTIAETAAALNGDLVAWGKPNVIPLTVAVLPDTDEDRNLSILWNVNRIGKNKVAVQDIITLVVTYPNGDQKILSNGVMISGPALNSGSSEGRLKTKEYEFSFESII
jgi:hypothetical protein